MRRSPFLAAIAPALALAAGLVRWVLQGSGNVYTQTARRAYVPDPDLGWRVVEGGPPWLGLEVLAIVLALLIAVIVGAWIVRRLERRAPRPALRLALFAIGVVPLVVPAWAFAGGFGPSGARDRLPSTVHAAPTADITGHLDAPAGVWDVVANDGAAITARVSAGGEAFDARFTGNLAGRWTGDPAHLDGPTSAEVSVDTASVDTGIDKRSKHARTEYLHADQYPRLIFRLDHVIAAAPADDAGGGVAFRAAGSVDLIGGSEDVEVTGTMRVLDDAARGRLGLPDAPAMLVDADFAVRIADCALAADAGDFDGDTFPIHATLILVHQGTSR